MVCFVFPNNNKATVAALFSGVVKTLNILEGDYVRKGQVIATIANPEYIRVQEQYLTTISRIAFAEQEYRRQNELYTNDVGTKRICRVLLPNSEHCYPKGFFSPTTANDGYQPGFCYQRKYENRFGYYCSYWDD